MNEWRTRLVVVLALLAMPLGAGGCAPMVVGGAAVGATVAAQERTAGAAAKDSAIHADIARRLLNTDTKLFQRVDISVTEGRVLLTGMVPAPQNRIDAARIAWQVDGVAEVINEIEVTDSSTLTDAARDSAISAQVRSRILFDRQIRSINYTIDTVNGRVHLLGIAQSQEELDRVIAHARDIPYVRGVVPHVRIKDAGGDGDGGA